MSTYFIRVAGQVREAYPHASILPPFYSPEHEFDRWLAETLAAHYREVAAKALEDAAGDFEAYVESGAPVGAGTTPEKWLRARAASLRGEGEEAQ